MHDQIFKDLLEQNYSCIEFPVTPEQIRAAIAAYQEFLKLPMEIKSHISFTTNPNSRRGDVGYVERDPKDSVYNDRKRFFHYHDAIKSRYKEFLLQQPIVRRFVESASPIWQAAYNKGSELMEIFEHKYPGIHSRFFAADEPEILLRFLMYDWQHPNENLAKPHYDVGSFTIAIGESDKGLRIGRSPETLKLIEHSPGEAVFMLAKNFPELVDDNEFSPSWHDVVQVGETTNKPHARWAIVCFFEASGMSAVGRADARTPMKNG